MAVAKVPKFGLTESGDSVELVERPRGGVTGILADGQQHGPPAKRLSQLVVAKAMHLVADGVRDGAVARGVHDYLYAVRNGKVTTELVLLSADTRTRTLVVTRNTHVPVLIRRADGSILRLDEPVEPIGMRETLRPVIAEIPLETGLAALACTDGVLSAGRRYGREWPVERLEELLRAADPDDMQALADRVLAEAMALDEGRPADDMSVLVVGVGDAGGDRIRRMSVTMKW
nr:PP2C family protein-serine/threonine phosphatase [Symbiobacterium terraclitae]